MSAIGPGDWVEALSSKHLTKGAVYQIEALILNPTPCLGCAAAGYVIKLVGQPLEFTSRTTGRRHYGFCRCGFRPWPGETDEALRCEPVDADEPTGVPA